MPTLSGLRMRAAKALRRPSSVPVAPRYPLSIPATNGYSPALVFDDCYSVAGEAIRDHARRVGRGKFLDVGSAGENRAFAGPFDYYALDVNERVDPAPWRLVGDICSCPHIESGQFDVIYNHRMMEFVAEPWEAAKEMGRLLRPGGLLVLITCFAWRYHPGLPDGSQGDYWRYTHDGLTHMLEKLGGLKTDRTGYDLRVRREDDRGGKIAGGLDIPPVDELGGFRESWTVWWTGRKPA